MGPKGIEKLARVQFPILTEVFLHGFQIIHGNAFMPNCPVKFRHK